MMLCLRDTKMVFQNTSRKNQCGSEIRVCIKPAFLWVPKAAQSLFCGHYQAILHLSNVHWINSLFNGI